jgi:hypothetical protein
MKTKRRRITIEIVLIKTMEPLQALVVKSETPKKGTP